MVKYGQVGHWTDGRIRNDMVNFVRSAMLKDVRSASSTTPRNLDVPTRNAPDVELLGLGRKT
ncbi:MAG: hypothetical protein P8I38_02120 [Arenicella sp.]|nr:hypothetical protein [Arenicella sp.]